MQILPEMWNGASRFNDFRRGVGWISPSLLSKRLKELESNGLIEREEDPASGSVDYLRTGMAIALEPVLDAMGHWAQRHVRAGVALDGIDLASLMWKIRRRVQADNLPRRRVLMRFHFSDSKLLHDTYWLLAMPGSPVELCETELGQDVDLYLESTVHALGAVYAGRSTFERDIEKGEIFLSGDTRVVRTIDQWLHPNDYAQLEGTPTLLD